MDRQSLCFCETHNCEGAQISYNDFYKHQRDDEENVRKPEYYRKLSDKPYQRQRQAEEELASGIFSITFEDKPSVSNVQEQQHGAISPKSLISPIIQNPIAPPLELIPEQTSPPLSSMLGPLDFAHLVSLRREMDSRVEMIGGVVATCSTLPALSREGNEHLIFLLDQEKWVLNLEKRLRTTFHSSTDVGSVAIRHMMLQQLQRMIQTLHE